MPYPGEELYPGENSTPEMKEKTWLLDNSQK